MGREDSAKHQDAAQRATLHSASMEHADLREFIQALAGAAPLAYGG